MSIDYTRRLMPPKPIRPPAATLVEILNRSATIEAAAGELGVHRATLHDWMRELGIERGDYRLSEEAETANA